MNPFHPDLQLMLNPFLKSVCFVHLINKKRSNPTTTTIRYHSQAESQFMDCSQCPLHLSAAYVTALDCRLSQFISAYSCGQPRSMLAGSEGRHSLYYIS